VGQQWQSATQGTVATRDKRVVAYATTLTFFPAAHAVAETEQDMSALIAGAVAAGEAPASFLLPTRQHELFRWRGRRRSPRRPNRRIQLG
jgi:hypothetical protein